VLSALPARAALTAELPLRAFAGERVAGRILLSGRAPASASLRSGRLPPGLTVKMDGTIEGVISGQAEPGLYAFSIEARSRDGLEGWGAFALDVALIEADAQPRCGCSSAFGIPLVEWLPVLLLARVRRRKK
jgi:hypothetical protein